MQKRMYIQVSPNNGTIDAIFITHQIIEKAKEQHNVHVHFNYVDFKSVFNTIWREALCMENVYPLFESVKKI